MRLWTKAGSRIEAVDVMVNAALLAGIQCGAEVILAVLSYLGGYHSYGAWVLVDAAMHFYICRGLFKTSEGWAVFGFIYQCSALVVGLIRVQILMSIIVGCLTVAYANAMQGAYYLKSHPSDDRQEVDSVTELSR